MADVSLAGREREIGVLDELVGRVRGRGGALVVRGEVGIGKSALLTAAGGRAKAQGLRVLTTTGVQSETHLPFAGLHQLLRPVLAGADTLPARQCAALLAAFGMTEEAAPELFLIALAALDLLADVAAQNPLLLVVDDAQWLDRGTVDVLGFVARRLEAEPIVLLIASRDGHDAPAAFAGLPELPLEGLDTAAAGALLHASDSDRRPRSRCAGPRRRWWR
jgi:predicted ATPase